MFDHEKLQVYGKALDFAAKAAAWTNIWDKRHAMVAGLFLNPGPQSEDKFRSYPISSE